MEPLSSLRPQMSRQIPLLRTSATRLSLMSVVIPGLSKPSAISAIQASVAPTDMVGLLEDGSIGIFALRGPGPDGGAGVDDRFLPRLQAVLRRVIATGVAFNARIRFRSVHRWAVEIAEADDLIATLFGTPTRMVGVDAVSAMSLSRQMAAGRTAMRF